MRAPDSGGRRSAIQRRIQTNSPNQRPRLSSINTAGDATRRYRQRQQNPNPNFVDEMFTAGRVNPGPSRAPTQLTVPDNYWRQMLLGRQHEPAPAPPQGLFDFPDNAFNRGVRNAGRDLWQDFLEVWGLA